VSAIQMRFAGFKGVLVCHKGLGKIQPDGNMAPHFLFRDSMNKYHGRIFELSTV